MFQETTMFFLRLLTVICLAVPSLVCGILDPHEIKPLTDANSDFAFRLYKYVVSETTGNVLFSPFSISTALTMVSSGARGVTQQEIYKTLGYTLLEEDYVLDMTSKLLKIFDVNNESYNMTSVNKLYGEQSYNFSQTFLRDLESNFGAELETVDFMNNSTEARESINTWIEDKTNNKIQDFAAPGSVSPSTLLYLVNAIYFDAKWRFLFDPQNNLDNQNFYRSRNDVRKVTYMRRSGAMFEYRYADLTGLLDATMLELPYSNETDVCMYVLLPRRIDGLSRLESELSIEDLNGTGWRNIFNRLQPSVVNVRLPKFSTTKTVQLKAALQKLGIVEAFQSDADFGRISPDGGVYLSDAAHKAYINVHEAGTEAAAATSFGSRRAANFFADHPFIYLIRERTSGTILFMGRYVAPPADGGGGQQIMDQTAYSSPWHWFYSKLGLPVTV